MGTHESSGADADLTLVLIGDKGASPPQALARPPGDHSKPHAEVLDISSGSDFGKLGAVAFTNRGTGAVADIQILKVVVDKLVSRGIKVAANAQRWTFPCYGWVAANSSRLFFEGTALLPQTTPAWMRESRAAEVARSREIYSWGFHLGFPAGIQAAAVADLPRDDQLPAAACLEPLAAATALLEEQRLTRLLERNYAWDAVGEDDHPSSILTELFIPGMHASEANSPDAAARDLYMTPGWKLPAPEAAVRGPALWMDDAEFGRLATQGPNPCMLKAFSMKESLPEDFLIPELTSLLGKGLNAPTTLQKILRLGQSVSSETTSGRVYIIDYRRLAEYLPDGSTGRFASAPVCLFYVSDVTLPGAYPDASAREKVLYPVAIKLDMNDPTAPVFTPNDDKWDWLTAKLFFANADAHYHVIASRYIQTQAVMEPFAVSALRNMCVMVAISPLIFVLGPTFIFSFP